LIDLFVKVNNQTGGVVRITDGHPVVSWEFDETDVIRLDPYGPITSSTFIDQATYRVRIGDSPSGWGTDAFLGDLMDTGLIASASRQSIYTGLELRRGTRYYGQVIVVDTEGQTSGWVTFSFLFNSLPRASDLRITPESPSINDNLSLQYTYTDVGGDAEQGTLIRWFRNGVHERQFDNQTSINKRHLQYRDVWHADVMPGDGFENGTRSTALSVAVQTTAPVASELRVLPSNPNKNDIFRAAYDFASDIFDDQTLIRWYVNDVLQSAFNDMEFARLSVGTGDQVRFEAQPFDGVVYGETKSSLQVDVVPAGLSVEDVRIDGLVNPLSLLSLRPVISWTVRIPPGREWKYASILVGTFAGSGNILFTVVETSQPTFTIPSNILNRGRDYYVAIAVSDVEDVFESYKTSHFRIAGSRWDENANNATGWTIEAAFLIDQAAEFDSSQYQVLRFEDGTRFGEVRILAGKVGFLSDGITMSSELDMGSIVTLTVTGQGNDVMVYLDRTLVIDGTGKFTQSASGKRLEAGAVVESPLEVHYRSFSYTTAGVFAPGSSSEYGNIQFHTFANFQGGSATGIEGYLQGGIEFKVFAVNPNEANDSATIYKIAPNKAVQYATVNRTFSPINRIRQSLNGLYKVIAHSRGAAVFKSYIVPQWSSDSTFSDAQRPEDNLWQLSQTLGVDPTTLNSSGLTIDTSFKNTGGNMIL